ncbi:MAG: endo-1,4-beta-xylanase [Armatimonadota bacterium]|nr:endo-1,4-beta-xylanase [Armatimonadota bacterium]
MKPFHSLFLLLFGLSGLALPSPAQTARSLSPLSADLTALQPVSLLPENSAAAVTLRSAAGVAQPAVLTHLGAERAFRVQNFAKTANFWDVEASVATEKPVKKGDVCLVRFLMRTVAARQESGESIVTLFFQQAAAPYNKSVTMRLGTGPEWTAFDVPFEVHDDMEAGGGSLNFGLSALEQTVEIKDVQMLNFDKSTALTNLPITRFSYAGREEGAAWRQEALARIEQIRTAPIVIRVQDKTGQPVANTRVQVHMVRSAFAFGSAVKGSLLSENTPQAQLYRDKVLELFDTVTIENDLKWASWQWENQRASGLQAVDWVTSKGLRLRGHNLVWPSYNFTPKRLQTLADPSAELPRQIETRIEDVVTATQGKTWAWDVLNEPLHERDFYKHFPDTLSAEWFKQARRLDPNSKLFVNEYAMLNGSGSSEFIKRYLAFIKMLQDNGAPLDGIGVQGHIGNQVENPVDVLKDLDLLQTSGLPVQITEFDIKTTDEQLQADYTRDFLIACYSHPAVDGFIMWGFWQGAHWIPEAAMFRTDWSEKPAVRVWREWVLDKWRTRLDLQTDAQGRAAGRGHLGIYEITITTQDQKLTHMMQLTRDRGEVLLTLR